MERLLSVGSLDNFSLPRDSQLQNAEQILAYLEDTFAGAKFLEGPLHDVHYTFSTLTKQKAFFFAVAMSNSESSSSSSSQSLQFRKGDLIAVQAVSRCNRFWQGVNVNTDQQGLFSHFDTKVSLHSFTLTETGEMTATPVLEKSSSQDFDSQSGLININEHEKMRIRSFSSRLSRNALFKLHTPRR
eukprot:Lithocolla_globosa_v1_NODE_2615_length_1933_cov_6.440895.p2 type:complete len:186 gc:universal NODE_2615_length_1933_cov_6.440895:1159-1716(+)